MRQRVAEAERICGHRFERQELIESALTHPSAAEGKAVSASYERLEFLGDSILGAIVATDLFERFPDMDEGALTQAKISLVSGKMLSSVAERLGVGPLIVMGESELGTGARGMHSALENVYEALVGALYLDAGYNATHAFVMETLGPEISPELARKPISPKSRLQEVTQREMRSTMGAGTRPPYDGTAKTARSPGSNMGTRAPSGVTSTTSCGTPHPHANRSATARVVPAPLNTSALTPDTSIPSPLSYIT